MNSKLEVNDIVHYYLGQEVHEGRVVAIADNVVYTEEKRTGRRPDHVQLHKEDVWIAPQTVPA
jgi:hypothetical protein